MTPICITLAPWIPYALAAAALIGAAIGFSLRVGIDWSELAAYRRAARREP